VLIGDRRVLERSGERIGGQVVLDEEEEDLLFAVEAVQARRDPQTGRGNAPKRRVDVRVA
jgi:hypothetical protein